MSDIEFDADIQDNPHYSSRSSSPVGVGGLQQSYQSNESNVGMANWLIRHGIISGQSSAKAILIGVVVINFVAAGLILYFFVLR